MHLIVDKRMLEKLIVLGKRISGMFLILFFLSPIPYDSDFILSYVDFLVTHHNSRLRTKLIQDDIMCPFV